MDSNFFADYFVWLEEDQVSKPINHAQQVELVNMTNVKEDDPILTCDNVEVTDKPLFMDLESYHGVDEPFSNMMEIDNTSIVVSENHTNNNNSNDTEASPKKKKLSTAKRVAKGEVPTCRCDVCNLSFYSRSTLLRHRKRAHGHIPKAQGAQRVTNGDVPKYRCETCDLPFFSRTTLHDHKKRAHGHIPKVPLSGTERVTNGDVPKYRCGACDLPFFSQSRLYDHKKKAHNHVQKKYKRGGKNKSLLTENEFLSDETESSSPAMNSSNSSTTSSKANKNTVYVCPTCAQEFLKGDSFKTHMRHHTGAYRLKCETCSYSCDGKAQLTLHEKRHGRKATPRQPTTADVHVCPPDCSCKLPLLKLNRLNPKGKCQKRRGKTIRDKSKPEIVLNPTEDEITNHTISLMRGVLDGIPLTLPLHHSVLQSVIISGKKSWIICQSNHQADLQDAIMFLEKTVASFQVDPHDANYLTKIVRQIILGRVPEWSMAHRVRGGDCDWPQDIQNQIMEIVQPYITEIQGDEEYITACIVQKELHGDRVRPNIGKMYETTICFLCNKNLKFRGYLKDHICNHKSAVVNKLKYFCATQNLEEPTFSIKSIGKASEVTTTIGGETFKDTAGVEERAYVNSCCLAYSKLSGNDMTL